MSKDIQSLDDLTPDAHNANAGTERGVYMVETSLEQYGAGRSILVDKEGRVIAGNKTLQAAIEKGFDIEVIRTDGKRLVVVQREDLDLESDNRARLLAYADNRASEVGLEWNVEQIVADIASGLDLSELWHDSELEVWTNFGLSDPTEDDFLLSEHDVPDALWPTDNKYEVPLLDINLQAQALETPVEIWGETKRKRRMSGTWLFYTEDYRYKALWDNPADVLNTDCVAVSEPNFSCYRDMPIAVGLWAIYRKRWLSRYWQSFGKSVFVDLNVNEKFYDLNLLGVPKGWKSYATRGYSDRVESTLTEYEMACKHAESTSILFVVYGGGLAVKEMAHKHGWIWIPEQQDVAKGRYEAFDNGKR